MRKLILALAVSTATATPSFADQSGKITLDLNGMEDFDGACRLTFMATNASDVEVDKFVMETVMLDTDGRVQRLTMFDLRNLPVGKPRVRLFDVPKMACETVGEVLINGVHACQGEGLDAAACQKMLELTSKVDAGLIG